MFFRFLSATSTAQYWPLSLSVVPEEKERKKDLFRRHLAVSENCLLQAARLFHFRQTDRQTVVRFAEPVPPSDTFAFRRPTFCGQNPSKSSTDIEIRPPDTRRQLPSPSALQTACGRTTGSCFSQTTVSPQSLSLFPPSPPCPCLRQAATGQTGSGSAGPSLAKKIGRTK